METESVMCGEEFALFVSGVEKFGRLPHHIFQSTERILNLNLCVERDEPRGRDMCLQLEQFNIGLASIFHISRDSISFSFACRQPGETSGQVLLRLPMRCCASVKIGDV